MLSPLPSLQRYMCPYSVDLYSMATKSSQNALFEKAKGLILFSKTKRLSVCIPVVTVHTYAKGYVNSHCDSFHYKVVHHKRIIQEINLPVYSKIRCV